MECKYIIIQAGGKGTRMETLTRNKPKALVPVDNLPMIFHLFRKFPDTKFIIIGDYKYDVLKKYLQEFATVDYCLIYGTGHAGTCAGIGSALEEVPESERFMLIWCDLVLSEDYQIPETDENIVGLSGDFQCRWSYVNGRFEEEKSAERGVAGFFVFRNKSYLRDVPTDGEFVRWLQKKEITFKEQMLYKAHEYGLFSVWDELPKMRTRPFNRSVIEGNKFYKIPVDEQGEKLAVRERAWYKRIAEFGFKNIPKIYEYDPLCMEKISGKNLYEYSNISFEQKKDILKKVVDCLYSVHGIDSAPVDKDSFIMAYLGKTYERLEKVYNLVPFAKDRIISVNGKVCRNIFYSKKEVEEIVMNYIPDRFCVIHGDCTFSNIMLTEDGDPVLIDPRGYFGKTEIYGDAAYDWVKLYYSLISNYDQFNLKRFNLYINEEDESKVYYDRGNEVTIPPKSVKLEIASSNWEGLEQYFFELLEGEVTQRQMKIFLAITWLSLTTYAWEDYDSICGAFYHGSLLLEEALSMEEEYDIFVGGNKFESAYCKYFEKNMDLLVDAAKTIDIKQMDQLCNECENTLRSGNKIVVSGLGKNVPICEKFVGTMWSMGFEAGFMHTNTAVHGDIGMVQAGDLVIVLTKSGYTAESVYLVELLKKRPNVSIWLLSFSQYSELARMVSNKLIIHLEHEGDLWNIVPNNSTTLNLIVLQEIAVEMSRRFNLDLERDFKPNHPGGAIGEQLKNKVI